jgi:hypothetical protein
VLCQKILLRVLGVMKKGTMAKSRGWTQHSARAGAGRRSRNGQKLLNKGGEVVRRAIGMVSLAEDVMNTEQADAGAPHNPGAKSVAREGIRMSGERVYLVPVHKGKDEE